MYKLLLLTIEIQCCTVSLKITYLLDWDFTPIGLVTPPISLSSQPLTTTIPFFDSMSHMSRFMQYFSYCDWHISLSMMSSEFILLYIAILIFVKAEQYSTVCIYHVFFIHSPANGHLGCLDILVIVNSAAINRVFISSLRYRFQFFWINNQKWILGSYDSSIFNFWEPAILLNTQ